MLNLDRYNKAYCLYCAIDKFIVLSVVPLATEEYLVSSADCNKISSNTVYTLAQSSATVSTSQDSPTPSKPTKRRFTEKVIYV